jgi:hypothetical protein
MCSDPQPHFSDRTEVVPEDRNGVKELFPIFSNAQWSRLGTGMKKALRSTDTEKHAE